jgi:lipopolysaccharide transport system ATP-binding protein
MARIEFDKVDLIYPVPNYSGTLKEYLLHYLFRREKKPPCQIHALKQVTFQIQDGERVGVIGYNGSGKSTLLRTIAGVFPIAGGDRNVIGSVCSLFDVGVGMESEATGWQNIYNRGYLQGETPSRLKNKILEIADFSELGEFLDLPLRCYSEGMIMRLAFAIATSSDPEILLIDEVFGAGDAVFQKKAEKRMKDFLNRARIVVMVMHHLEFLEEFCTRVMWIHQGQIHRDGPAREIISAYRKEVSQRQLAAAA